jgi:LPXTG-motif cell wall-anchored protein
MCVLHRIVMFSTIHQQPEIGSDTMSKSLKGLTAAGVLVVLAVFGQPMLAHADELPTPTVTATDAPVAPDAVVEPSTQPASKTTNPYDTPYTPDQPPTQSGQDVSYEVTCDYVLTTTTVPWTLDATLVEDSWVFDDSNKVYGDAVITTSPTTPDELTQLGVYAPNPCQPTVVPASPAGSIGAICGAVDVTASNPFTPAEGTIGTPATFVVKIDGEVKDTFTLEPGAADRVLHYEFPEDSGDHVVSVLADDVVLDTSPKISSDCATAAITGGGDGTDTLASTGVEAAVPALVAFGLIAAGLLLAFAARRRRLAATNLVIG